MTRSKSLVTAAVLQVILSLFDGITAIPILAAGSQGLPPLPGAEEMGGPPFWAGIMFVVLAVVGLFGAYGVWFNQRWGKVITIATRAVLMIFALGDILGSVVSNQWSLGLVSVGYVILSIVTIVLVLRRTPQLVRA